VNRTVVLKILMKKVSRMLCLKGAVDLLQQHQNGHFLSLYQETSGRLVVGLLLYKLSLGFTVSRGY
jgi:hypothetical protein